MMYAHMARSPRSDSISTWCLPFFLNVASNSAASVMLLFKRKTKYNVISEIPATFALFAKYQQLSENNLQPGQSTVAQGADGGFWTVFYYLKPFLERPNTRFSAPAAH